MFKVMDGNQEVLRYLYHFYHYVRCDDILVWLIKNKLTGKEFISWAKTHFGMYHLAVGNFIIAKINQDPSYKILHGRDFI